MYIRLRVKLKTFGNITLKVLKIKIIFFYSFCTQESLLIFTDKTKPYHNCYLCKNKLVLEM